MASARAGASGRFGSPGSAGTGYSLSGRGLEVTMAEKKKIKTNVRMGGEEEKEREREMRVSLDEANGDGGGWFSLAL